MSQEIDLSFVFAALRRRWWVVAACMALALALAALLHFSQPDRYTATNTLLVQSPRYQWRFDNSVTSQTNLNRDYQREILAIGRTDEIAQSAAAALNGAATSAAAEEIKNAVSLRAGDGNTIIVSATASDPEQAARYARAWTEQLIESARTLYSTAQDLPAFQDELARTAAALQEAEDKLAAARSASGIFATADLPNDMSQSNASQMQLVEVNQTLAGYRNAIQTLRYLDQQVGQVAPPGDLTRLPWELLDTTPITLTDHLSAADARVLLGDPAGLQARLAAEADTLQAAADALASQADALRGQVAADWQAYEIAFRERNWQRDIYLALQRKVTELTMQGRVDPSLLTAVGSTEPLVTQVRSQLIGLAITAAVAGLIAGVLLALWLEARSGRVSRQTA